MTRRQRCPGAGRQIGRHLDGVVGDLDRERLLQFLAADHAGEHRQGPPSRRRIAPVHLERVAAHVVPGTIDVHVALLRVDLTVGSGQHADEGLVRVVPGDADPEVLAAPWHVQVIDLALLPGSVPAVAAGEHPGEGGVVRRDDRPQRHRHRGDQAGRRAELHRCGHVTRLGRQPGRHEHGAGPAGRDHHRGGHAGRGVVLGRCRVLERAVEPGALGHGEERLPHAALGVADVDMAVVAGALRDRIGGVGPGRVDQDHPGRSRRRRCRERHVESVLVVRDGEVLLDVAPRDPETIDVGRGGRRVQRHRPEGGRHRGAERAGGGPDDLCPVADVPHVRAWNWTVPG